VNKVLVTGASGFVGRTLCEMLVSKGVLVTAAVRNTDIEGCVFIGEINAQTEWADVLVGVDCVVHLAARVHVMNETSSNPLEDYRCVNVKGTQKLARDAAKAGVKRLVYLSTIKVNGENTFENPFTEKDIPHPVGPYALSKMEAENSLRQISDDTGMSVVIIRPVLVYGPGVKANFQTMMRWLVRGVPLPLGAIHNKRSLVALDNLVDLIATCIDHPAAANQTFLVSDDEDLSSTELLRRMAGSLDKRVCFLPVPAVLLQAGAVLLGRRDVAQRLLESLQVDISQTKAILGWTPPVSVDDALKKTAEDFLSRASE